MRVQYAILAIAAASGIARADIPQMGGAMSHLLVSIFDHQVYIGFESPSMSTVELLEGSGEFNGAASVLNGLGHNSQFGWLANGFISLPPSSGVFVRAVSMSPYLEVYSEFGYAPILGTDGSDPTWRWNGTMTHNWFASDVKGPHEATFEVFVGDLSGNPLEGWTSGTINLRFIYGGDPNDRVGVRNGATNGDGNGAGNGGAFSTIPTPGSLAILSAGLVAIRRRR